MLGGIVLTVTADRPLSKWLISVVRRWQSDILADLQPPPIAASRLLILCSRSDEAHEWLRAWDLVSHAPIVVAGVLLSVLGIAGRVLLQPRFEDASLRVMAAVAVSAAIVVISGGLRWLGYGREWVWPHLLIAIRAARTPNDGVTGPHTENLLDVPRPPVRAERWRRRLRHKAICHTPTVTVAITDWIARCVPPGAGV